MGLSSFIKKQFIDIIQWTESEEDILAWHFPMQDMEIQSGASLTVRESQMAVFVDEGRIADVFAPGRYKLTTQTLPILTYLKNWDKLFESPFKSDVYFFSTRLQLGRKWGTPQPITIRDKEFGMVRLRAFGMYSYKINDPCTFFKEISGTKEVYTSELLEEQLRNLVVTTMSATFGNANLPFVDMAANQTLLSEKINEAITPNFERYGLELDNFAVENVSLPESLQKTIDERISMGMVGDLGRYTQYQTAASIPLAAQNEGGVAGIGVGMGAGVGMGQVMANALRSGMIGSATTTPAESSDPVSEAETPEARLTTLKKMLNQLLITQEDYDRAKADILKKLIG